MSNRKKVNKNKENDNLYKHNNRKKEKKKSSVIKKILLFILVVLLAFVGYFTYRTYKNGWGLSGFLATVAGHNENTKKNLSEIQFLILGISTDQANVELTDTIMVASYNPNTQSANLLSIPRDTFTGKNVSTANQTQKINAVYNMTRKPEKVLEKVNDITGLKLENYVIIRTESLIQLVDAIGGVDFYVPRDMYYTDKTQDLIIDLKKGMQHLDGDKSEQLLRFRKNNDGTSYPPEYGDNDLGRMRTQREFISAVLKQTLKPTNIFKINEIMEIMEKNIETNIEYSLAKDYIPYAVDFKTEKLKTATLPGYTPDMKDSNNVSIFVADKTKTKKLVQEMFYPELVEDETTTNKTNNTSKIKIEILNGSGDTNKLTKAKNLLTNAGFNVSKVGTSESTISKTIITNKNNTSEDILKAIKNIVGAGNIENNNLNSNSVDVTIILGKDFN